MYLNYKNWNQYAGTKHRLTLTLDVFKFEFYH